MEIVDKEGQPVSEKEAPKEIKHTKGFKSFVTDQPEPCKDFFRYLRIRWNIARGASPFRKDMLQELAIHEGKRKFYLILGGNIRDVTKEKVDFEDYLQDLESRNELCLSKERTEECQGMSLEGRQRVAEVFYKEMLASFNVEWPMAFAKLPLSLYEKHGYNLCLNDLAEIANLKKEEENVSNSNT